MPGNLTVMIRGAGGGEMMTESAGRGSRRYEPIREAL